MDVSSISQMLNAIAASGSSNRMVTHTDGELDSADAVVESIKRGDFEAIFEKSMQIEALPRKHHLTLVELACSILQQPIPVPSDFESRSSNKPDMSACWRSFSAMAYFGSADMSSLLGRGDLRTRRLVERTWPGMLKWMHFLVTDPSIAGSKVLEVTSITQLIGYSVCNVLWNFNQVASFSEKLVKDTLALQIVISAILQQDVDELIKLHHEHARSDFPSNIFLHILTNRLGEQMTKRKETLKLLSGREHVIIRRVVQHLQYVYSPSAPAISRFYKISAHIQLLVVFLGIKSFERHLVKNRVVTAVVDSLKFLTDISNIPPGLDRAYTTGSVASCLQLLVFFYSQPRADLVIRLTLRHRLESALSAISQSAHSLTTDGNEIISIKRMELLLMRIAAFTTFRTVVMDVQRASTRAFLKSPGLAKSGHHHELWFLFQRYATERAVCKYLFDEAYRRNGSRCNTCNVRILRYEIKRCGECQMAAYCSRQCQAALWPNHKLQCKEMKDAKIKSEAASGRYDSFFQTGLAACDISRLLPCIYDYVKKSDTSISLDNIQIIINYCTSPEQACPTAMYRRLSKAEAELAKSTIKQMAQLTRDTRVQSGELRYLLPEVVFPVANTNSSHAMRVPVNKKWIDAAYNPRHPLRARQPEKIADKGFQRVVFGWTGLNGEEKMKPLGALGDDVDDVLFELARVTEAQPTWSFSDRVSFAAERVDERIRSDGRDHNLFTDWIC